MSFITCVCISFGQFLAATLPLWTVSEAKFTCEEIASATSENDNQGKTPGTLFTLLMN